MHTMLHAALAVLVAITPAVARADELTIDGPKGPRTATLVHPAPHATTVLIVPETAGPRDEMAPAADYDLLADAFRERGFGTLRLDASTARKPAKLATRAAEAAAFAVAAKRATGSPCVWLLGHGSGGHVAAQAARSASDVCGVIMVGAPARGAKDQRRAADAAGHLAGMSLPTMIVVGGSDDQVGFADGQALHAALPTAQLAMVLGMSRTLKDVSPVAEAALAPPPLWALAVSERLVDAIGTFMLDKGPQLHGSLQPRKAKSRGSRRA